MDNYENDGCAAGCGCMFVIASGLSFIAALLIFIIGLKEVWSFIF
ncbi:hypothetical protein [Culicoidibacter larvae]|nr:hypothetical protein [Culicoidibacter larvae]